MAKQIDGRVHLTANINAGSEAAWKKVTTEIEEKIKAALEGLETKVTVSGARLDFVQTATIIGAAESADEPEGDQSEDADGDTSDDDDADVPDTDEDEKPKKDKKSKGKKDKAEKAAKGKKKGRS